MVRLKQFSCRRCGTTFMLRARKAYYCPECRKNTPASMSCKSVRKKTLP